MLQKNIGLKPNGKKQNMLLQKTMLGLFKNCQRYTRCRPNTSIPIKNKTEAIQFSEDGQNARLVEHFSEVLNQPIILTIVLDLNAEINNVNDDISMNDISKEEIVEGLRALANNKAAGSDFIPSELLK